MPEKSTKTVRTRKLEPGEHVLEAFDEHENLLIRDFWVDTEQDISRLEELGVHRATVLSKKIHSEKPSDIDEADRPPPTHQRAPSASELAELLQEAPNLVRETQSLYRHTVTKIKDMFFSADRMENVDADELMPFIEKVADYSSRSPGSVAVLTQIEDFDYDTFRHSVNMGILSILYAQYRDFDDTEIAELALGAMLHDIGKIRIPEQIILKEGPLNDEEYEMIKTHTTKGKKMLEKLGIGEPVRSVALEHHERPDESGYPDGTGQIHPYSRIISVFDVYDAMTSQRVYSDEVTPNRAFAVLRNEFGSYPETRPILYDLMRCLGLYPVGSLVRLTAGELAIVQRNHPQKLKHPVVCVIIDEQQNRLESPFLLDLNNIQKHKAMKNDKVYDYHTEVTEILSLDEIPDFGGDDVFEILGKTGI